MNGEPKPPGLLRRLAAILYDSLLLCGVLFAATGVWLAFSRAAVQPGNLAFQLYLLAVIGGYFCLSWTRGGQTLGMKAWRLRLQHANGGAVGWPRALGRCAAALLSWLPAGLGFWWSLFDPQRLAWHDRWTATRLVILKKPVKGRGNTS